MLTSPARIDPAAAEQTPWWVFLQIHLLLSAALVGGMAQAEHADYQFSHNAKLAGRSLACGDRAGYAGIRNASKKLLPFLAGGDGSAKSMKAFDKRARLQRRLTERATGKRAVCERIADEIFANLDRTQVISATSNLPAGPSP